MNTNESTVIHGVGDIDNINIDNPELKENILTGQCIGVDIKKKTACCMVCNKSLPTEVSDDEMITCNNCKITILSSLLKTKLVCHILVNTEDGMRNYACFNDAIQSFLTKIKNTTPIADIPLNDLKKLLLKVGNQRMIVDKTAKIITQFL